MKVSSCVFAVIPLMAIAAQPNLALYNATRKGARVNVCLHIVDHAGHPVPDAKLWGGMQTGDGFNDFSPIEGLSDTNGDFVVNGKCTNRLRCRIRKNGYYQSDFSISFPKSGVNPPVVDGKWQPFGSTNTVVLKAIRNPNKCRVFPDALRNWRIPEWNKWIGFDFESADWTAPYGKGSNLDVLLRFSSREKSINDYKYVMEVSFTNNLFAGVYLLKKDNSSKLTTLYEADSNAMYQASFSYVSEQTPGNPRHWDFLGRDSYLVFRTRTRVDEYGNLVAAHYGKILGRWLSDTEFMILSDGCFNPVENDVNIEDGNGLRDILRDINQGVE